MHIQGQAAVVTGGASGLGEATARALAALGAQVAILDRNEAGARRVADALGGVACACDITDPASVQAALAQARLAHGPARILMNVAGVGSAKRVVQKDGSAAPLEDFSRVVQVNLIGTYNVSRLFAANCAALDPLEDGERGVMLFTASVAAFDGQVGQQAYSASKAALVGMTLPMARDLAQHGIRVHHCAWHFCHPLADGVARGRAGLAGRLHSISQAFGPARGICRTGLPHRHQWPPQWRGDPSGRRAAHGGALNVLFSPLQAQLLVSADR